MTRCRPHLPAVLLLLGLVLVSPQSPADSSPKPAPLGRSAFQRPHAVAQFDLGVLLLPGTEACTRPANCTAAPISLLASAWPLYRAFKHFSFGAGLTIGYTPTRQVLDADSEIARTHSNSYFIAEATTRYIPVAGTGFETWVGVTTGFVVVNDGFTIERNQPDLRVLGENGSSMATEGLALGGAGGLQWALAPGLKLGGSLRMGLWLLPETAQRTALGDTASLRGAVPFFVAALTLSYGPSSGQR